MGTASRPLPAHWTLIGRLPVQCSLRASLCDNACIFSACIFSACVGPRHPPRPPTSSLRADICECVRVRSGVFGHSPNHSSGFIHRVGAFLSFAPSPAASSHTGLQANLQRRCPGEDSVVCGPAPSLCQFGHFLSV